MSITTKVYHAVRHDNCIPMHRISFFETTPRDQAFFSNAFHGRDVSISYNTDIIHTEACDPETTILSVFVHSQITEAVMDRMPNLKLICCRSTGYDNVNLVEATKRGITVINVPSYGEHTVAEHAFALILSLTKQLFANRTTAAHRITDVEAITGIDLYGKTLGVLGTGKIGSNIITIANAFGMKVVAYDPFPNEALKTVCTYTDFAAVLAESDIITLHLPYTKHNHHLINKQAFAQMKQGAYLINTARGELVDTTALIDALQTNTLAGAGLDVFEGEQFMHADKEICALHTGTPTCDLETVLALSVLKQLPQVIITPHNAYNTIEAINRINTATVEHITACIGGTAIQGVNAKAPEMGKLIVARHHESEWNAKGLWTGSRDTHLTEKGFAASAQMGLLISGIKIEQSFASSQLRSLETLSGMLGAMQQFAVPLARSSALNERDYGDYTGKNKWDMKELIGEEAFDHIRRDWDCPVPNGETLKVVYERVIPYFKETILPYLKQGKNVLIVSHGNAIRALMKYIENISDADVSHIEMLFGAVVLYDLDHDGHLISKEVRTLPDPHINA